MRIRFRYSLLAAAAAIGLVSCSIFGPLNNAVDPSSTSYIGTPTSLSPASQATSITPTLAWQDSGTASEYRVEVTNSSGFSSTIVDTTTKSTSYRVATALSLGVTYLWRVAAITNDGKVGLWAAAQFTVPSSLLETIAGNGSVGYSGDGGAATSATISGPEGIAIDSAGNVYIADTGNNVVRRVDTTGKITTIAGTATVGYSGDGGPATSAELSGSYGVAVDSSGNIFVADSGNNVIRKINPSGTISTVAGNGSSGYSGDGGRATAAELSDPRGIAVDTHGDLYIADTGNSVVRMVNSSGTISTVAGTGRYGNTGDGGPATSAELGNDYGVAVDSSGNVYIADGGNGVIRKVDTAGVISTVAGTGQQGDSGDGGPATSAQLSQPSGVAVDSSGNIYISDSGNNNIREVNASGTISTILTRSGTSTLGLPTDVAVSADGAVYIASSGQGTNYALRLK